MKSLSEDDDEWDRLDYLYDMYYDYEEKLKNTVTKRLQINTVWKCS